MATYRVQGPDGSIHRIEGPDDATPAQIEAFAAQQFNKPVEDRGGFLNAANAGFRRALGAAAGGGADLMARTGNPNLADALETYHEGQDKKAGEVFSPTTDAQVEGAWKKGLLPGLGAAYQQQLSEPAGGLAGRMGGTLAGGAAGTMLGGPVGGAVGAFAPEAAVSYGENIERQAQVHPGETPDAVKALAATLLQATVNTFGLGRVIHGGLGMNVATREAAKVAQQVAAGTLSREAAVQALGGTLRNVAAETAGATASGAAVGVVDEATRRAQADQPIDSPEALDEYKQAAVAAAKFGWIPGVWHGKGGRRAAENVIDQGANHFTANEQTAPLPPEGLDTFRQRQSEADAQRAADAEDARIQTEVAAEKASKEDFNQRMKAGATRTRQFLDEQQAQREATQQQDQQVGQNGYKPQQAGQGFAQATPDIYGNIHPQPDDTPPVQAGRRAADPEQFDLQAQDGQLGLPLEPRTEPAAPEPPPVVQPRITKPEDFEGLVYPRSTFLRDGKLLGRDLNDPAQLRDVGNMLIKYRYGLKQNPEKNADMITRLDQRIADLKQRMAVIDQPPPAGLDLQGGHAPTPAQQAFLQLQPNHGLPELEPKQQAAANGPARPASELGPRQQAFLQARPATPPGENNGQSPRIVPLDGAVERPVPGAVPDRVKFTYAKEKGAADHPAGGSAVGLRSEPEAVPGELPPPDGQGNAGSGQRAGPAVPAAPSTGRALGDALQEAAAAQGKSVGDVMGEARQSPPARLAQPLDVHPTPIPKDFNELKVVKDRLENALTQLEQDYPRSADPDILRLKGMRRAEYEHVWDRLNELSKLGENPQDYLKAEPGPQGWEQVEPGKVQHAVSNTVVNAIERDDPKGMLLNLARSANVRSSYRALARKLASMAELPRVTFFQVDPKYAGAYHPDEHGVSFNPHVPLSSHTILHEMMHGVTVWAFNHPDKLTPVQQRAVAQLNKIYGELQKNHPQLDKEYGMTNTKEMIAEAFSSPRFQALLQQIPMQRQTLWNMFAQKIGQLIGWNNNHTALQEIMHASLNIAEGHAQFRANERTDVQRYAGRTYKAADADPLPVNRISYDVMPPPERHHGPIERLARGAIDSIHDARTLKTAGGFKAFLDNKVWNIEQALGDSALGVTRHTDRGYTKDGQATTRALLQEMPYSMPIARSSLDRGGVEMNKEGSWDVAPSSDNLMTLVAAVKGLDKRYGDNPAQAFNTMAVAMTYAEREAKSARAKTDAVTAEAKAKTDLKAAYQLGGKKGADAAAKAKRQLAQAKALQDKTDYTRPGWLTDDMIKQVQGDVAADPQLRQAFAVNEAVNKQTIKTLEQGGVISHDYADELRQNKYYVPLQRLIDADANFRSKRPGMAGGIGSPTIHRFEGSEKDVDIFSNLVNQRVWATDAAMRNNAHLHAIRDIEPLGLARKLGEYETGTPNSVTVYDQGTPTRYQILDKQAYKTLEGIAQLGNGMIMRGIENTTALFREAIMLSPDAIARNMVRDITDVWMMNYTDQALGKVAKGAIGMFMKGMPDVMREVRTGQLHLPRYEVVKAGITGIREHTSTERELAKVLRDAQSAIGFGNPHDWAAKADTVLNRVHHALQGVAMEAEAATREKVYQDVLKKTGSLTEAKMAAINTMDFRRRGDWGGITVAKKLIPFFNSQLQGLYKIYQILARNDNAGMSVEQARRALLGKGIKMMVAASLYEAFMSNDDDYKAASKTNTDGSWLVPVGGGHFLKIPVNFELGKLFKTIPENGLRLMQGDISNREFGDALQSILTSSLPGWPPLPQVAKPLVEVGFNYNTFTGKPVESSGLQRLDKSERAYESTSKTAHAISQATSAVISPAQAQHILNGYFGSVGNIAVAAIDATLGERNSPAVPWYKQPVMRSMLTDPLHSRELDRYYALREFTTQAAATYKKMVDEGRMDDAERFLAKTSQTGAPNEDLVIMNRYVTKLDQSLKLARAEAKRISNDTSLSPSAKRAEIDGIRREVNAMMAEQMPGLRQASGE